MIDQFKDPGGYTNALNSLVDWHRVRKFDNKFVVITREPAEALGFMRAQASIDTMRELGTVFSAKIIATWAFIGLAGQ